MTTSSDSLRAALEDERDRLISFIAALPESKKVKHIEGLLALYSPAKEPGGGSQRAANNAQGSGKTRTFGYGEKTKAVEDAASAFLTDRGYRATSSDFLPYMAELGIEIGGKNPNSTLASFLSTSKRFNNLRGVGYGLVEWGDGPGPQANYSTLSSEQNRSSTEDAGFKSGEKE